LIHSEITSGLNDGVFILGRGALQASGTGAKTLIVSGLARSGTSMVARALTEAAVFLGDMKDDVVYEDHEISNYLERQELLKLRRAVATRNERFETWGFKKPNIHDFINPKHPSFFRNPYYIFTFRDPIAIAKRNIVSELFDEAMALSEVVKAQALMTKFILRLRHPTLLISYEKALQAPAQCVDNIVKFAGLQIDDDQRQRMLASIEPNRQEYLANARRFFQGSLDGIQGDLLRGWCRQVSLLEPIAVSLFINEKRVATMLADEYREDLASVGIGSGEHAFSVDLRKFKPDPSHAVRIFAHGRSFELSNSGKTIQELRAL